MSSTVMKLDSKILCSVCSSGNKTERHYDCTLATDQCTCLDFTLNSVKEKCKCCRVCKDIETVRFDPTRYTPSALDEIEYTGRFEAESCSHCRAEVVHEYTNFMYASDHVCQCGMCELDPNESVLSIRSTSSDSECEGTRSGDSSGRSSTTSSIISTTGNRLNQCQYPELDIKNRSIKHLHKRVVRLYQCSMRTYVPELISIKREKRALELGRPLTASEVYQMWKEFILHEDESR
jgi:hypothetical protein